MGYRSEVIYAMHFQSEDDLTSCLAFMRMHSNPTMPELLGDLTRVPDTNIIALIQYDIKWYDSYAYVQAADFLLDYAAHEKEASTLKMRIGEEIQDIVFEHYYQDHCGLLDHFEINRSIGFPLTMVNALSSLNKTEE